MIIQLCAVGKQAPNSTHHRPIPFPTILAMADPATPAAAAAGGGESKREEPSPSSSSSAAAAKKRRAGLMTRLRGMFGGGGEDFEKRLKYLSKEEASIHARMKRRAHSSRQTARNILVLAVGVEVVAVAYAIMKTRSLDLSWQMRAVRVLPMFLLPALFSAIYRAVVSFTRILERKDQKTLERLRDERRAKIDELKERTNYYTTQQLIQRYDLDPAAKAAAATVLATKLGEGTGLKVYLGDDSNIDAVSARSNDSELVQSNGIRNRKPAHRRSHSTGSAAMEQLKDTFPEEFEADGQEVAAQNQRAVGQYAGTGPNDGGWIARIAALLVGEDPTQCYALICSNCHMHNGLARKEDFPYVTYYCPHCNSLNGLRQAEEQDSTSTSGIDTPNPDTPGGYSNSSSGSSSSPFTNNAVIGSLPPVEESSIEESDEKEPAAWTG